MRTWAIVMSLLFILIVFAMFAYILEKTNPYDNDCVKLGCKEGYLYVADKNSDKFYKCGCEVAKQIPVQNRVCYRLEKDAVKEGKVKIDC